MIYNTPYTVDLADIEEALKHIPTNDRTTINRPTDRYFYDEWELKDEFKGTIWEKIYDSLPTKKGEARLITLDRGVNYYSHADIDDRWHLNICGERSYLIDLDNDVMHKITPDGKWYNMDAGRIHVGANFGSVPRTQLVVRQLLTRHELGARTHIKITIPMERVDSDARYRFDWKLSPWLNTANKMGMIDNFNFNGVNCVEFEVERRLTTAVLERLPDPDFDIIATAI